MAADGSREHPLADLGDLARCSEPGDALKILKAVDNAPPLDGGLLLKPGQRLSGEPCAVMTSSTGDAVVLAQDNEVFGLRIDNPRGAAVLGNNVRRVDVHDLEITRNVVAPMERVDAKLCRIVRTNDAIDDKQTIQTCPKIVFSAVSFRA